MRKHSKNTLPRSYYIRVDTDEELASEDGQSISSFNSSSEESSDKNEKSDEENGHLGDADQYLNNILNSSDDKHVHKKPSEESFLQKGSRSFGSFEEEDEEESSEEEEEPSKNVEDNIDMKNGHVSGNNGFQSSDGIQKLTFKDNDGYSSHADSGDLEDSFNEEHDMNGPSTKPKFDDDEKYLDHLLQSFSNEDEFEQEKKPSQDYKSPSYKNEDDKECGHVGKYRTQSNSLSLKKENSTEDEDSLKSSEDDDGLLRTYGTQPINAVKYNDFDQGKKSKKGKNLWEINFG